MDINALHFLVGFGVVGTFLFFFFLSAWVRRLLTVIAILVAALMLAAYGIDGTIDEIQRRLKYAPHLPFFLLVGASVAVKVTIFVRWATFRRR